ncbi:MAG: ABC transporter ATP-binding protein [Lachnospiraceae bacterium]
MKSLLKYLGGYKKECILAPLFKMLEATFELFVPLVMAAIIDTGIENGDKPYVIRMCLVLVVLGIVGLASSISAQFFAAKAAVGFSAKVRSALFAHIQSLSFSEMDTVGTSTLITRMTSDINQVQTGVNLVLRLFLRSPFIVFGAMIMAFTIDVKSALIFVVTIPLLSLVVFGIMLITMPMYKKVQGRLDTVLLKTRENLNGVRVIRAFNKENQEIESFRKSNEELNTAQKLVGKISGLMNPITYVIVNCAIVVLIWTGALRVDSGAITQGMVVALVNYMSQILVELIKLANLIITVTKSFACASRIESVFKLEPSVVTGSKKDNDSDIAVEFNDVTFAYANAGEPSLEGITFTAKKGETIGIIGGTGSGKTSLVSLIPRFYDVTSGSVKIFGTDAREYDLTSLRDMVGVVMQKAVLFSGTIRENICWGNKNATDADIDEALEISQSKEFVDAKEDGLDTVVEQGGKNLSGGQRQRLTIARAVVGKPQILILDDSASALDYATDARLRQALKKLPYNPTIFIVSQRAASLMHADKIIVLDEGKIAGIGKHNDLLESCDIYREIYESQFKKEGK